MDHAKLDEALRRADAMIKRADSYISWTAFINLLAEKRRLMPKEKFERIRNEAFSNRSNESILEKLRDELIKVEQPRER